MSARFLARLKLSLLAALLAACGDTGLEALSLALSVSGTPTPSLDVNGAVFTLSRADVALGPVYFCAAEAADTELCETALAEFTEVVSINGLAPEMPTDVVLHGTTGDVRSVQYDYGISWLPTKNLPVPTEPSAPHSAVLEGTVVKDGRTLAFRAEIEVLPLTAGATAVHGQRTRQRLEDGEQLLISVDPYAWLRAIDAEALFALDSTGSGQVRIERGSQAYEAILQGMQNRAPPSFVWRAP